MKSTMQMAFENWYGCELDEDMDIHTLTAWDNWMVAWNASAIHAAELCEQMARIARTTKGLRQYANAFMASANSIKKDMQ